jgi:hypothetical protein
MQGVVIGSFANLGQIFVFAAPVVALTAFVLGTDHRGRAGGSLVVSILSLMCTYPFLVAGTVC